MHIKKFNQMTENVNEAKQKSVKIGEFTYVLSKDRVMPGDWYYYNGNVRQHVGGPKWASMAKFTADFKKVVASDDPKLGLPAINEGVVSTSETTQRQFKTIVKGLPTTVKTDLLTLVRNSDSTPSEQRLFFQNEYGPVKFKHVSMELIDKVMALKLALVQMPDKEYDVFYNALFSDFS